MIVLAIKSSGEQTSVSIILNDEVISFSMIHPRKERPNWEILLNNIGLNSIFDIKDIDLFAFANNQNSFTATRSVASYMKGLAVALKKPLISVEDESSKHEKVFNIAKKAKEIFLRDGADSVSFDPKNANPSYEDDIQFKKLNE
tara:strand:- start:62 stop:493 length:432 start_codon:yes stop_codon:yes gene_type:complete